jgi:HEAT repeat protein
MPDFESLIMKLQSVNEEERREAVIGLGRAGTKAVSFLLDAIGDANWRVRKAAVEALVSLADDSVLYGLVRSLSTHDNAGARNSAIEALVRIGSAAVDVLLDALQTSHDPDVRKFIIDTLGDIRERRSVPLLIGSLNDAGENVRVAAAEALGRIRDRRAVAPLLSCLARTDAGWLDYAAAQALGEIGDERALGPLLSALDRSGLREPVLESLGRIGNAGTIDPLLKGLTDPLRIVREISLRALAAIYRKSSATDCSRIAAAVRESGDRTVEYLEQLVMTSSGELQKAAVEALGWIGRESSIRKLLGVLKDEDMEEPTVRALLGIDRDKIDLLLGFLHDDNALVRRTVARALGATGRFEAEEQLIELLHDENGHVRSSAAEALGRLRSGKAVEQLLPLLADEFENAQASAICALAGIGDESVIDRLVTDFTSRDPAMRRNIAILVGRFPGDRAAEALSFALKDEEPAVRKAAVHALGGFPSEHSYRSLRLAVTDDDPEVRRLGAEALGRLDATEVFAPLASLLKDPDLWVRASAARGLGRCCGEAAASLLLEHLSEAKDIFLLAIVEVLGVLRPEAALTPLLRMSDHEDPEIRKALLAALAQYPWHAVRQAFIAGISDPHWSVRKAAVEALRRKRDAGAAPRIERLAQDDPDGSVRQAAKEALVE